jgi:hypothetical protein
MFSSEMAQRKGVNRERTRRLLGEVLTVERHLVAQAPYNLERLRRQQINYLAVAAEGCGRAGDKTIIFLAVTAQKTIRRAAAV